MPERVKEAANPQDVAKRKEIITTIKGPVVEKLQELVPAFRAYKDPYGTIISSPDILHACVQLIRTKREHFQHLMVDSMGQPVQDDDAPLRCDRSLNQIIGMVVRSGAKAYAEKRFGEHATLTTAVVNPHSRGLLERLSELVRGKWSETEVPKPQPTQAAKFYAAIKDNLDYDWQVPLIPYFCEIPVKLINELGKGITNLRTPEGISALADIGRNNMEQARRILSDDMMREMLDTEPLAAKGIAFLGKDRYERLHGAVYEVMGEQFWEMCTDIDRLEMMEDQNAKDLENLAPWLHKLSADSIKQIIAYIKFTHMPIFLEVAMECLGEDNFKTVFGIGASPKLIKMFCEKVSRTPLDPAKPEEDLRNRLPDVFKAYLRNPKDFERGL